MIDKNLVHTIRENASLGCLSWKSWSGIDMHFDRNSFWFTSPVLSPIFNTIVELDPTSPLCESYLMSIEENLSTRDVPLAWMIPAEYQPEKELLTRYQYYQIGSTQGMICDLSDWDTSRGSQAEVITVDSDEDLFTWSKIIGRSYQFSDDWMYPWFDMHRAIGYGEDNLWEHFIVLEDGEGVAACSLFWGPDVPSLANVAVLPESKKKGYGRAVTESALSYAKMTMNPEYVTLFATDEGLPLYSKLGFKKCCETNIYQRAAILH